MIQEPKPGIYRHFKGQEYDVLGIGFSDIYDPQRDTHFATGFDAESTRPLHIYERRTEEGSVFVIDTVSIEGLTDDFSDVVIYRAHYNSKQFGSTPLWIRQRDNFLSKKQTEQGEVTRFEYQRPLEN